MTRPLPIVRSLALAAFAFVLTSPIALATAATDNPPPTTRPAANDKAERLRQDNKQLKERVAALKARIAELEAQLAARDVQQSRESAAKDNASTEKPGVSEKGPADKAPSKGMTVEEAEKVVGAKAMLMQTFGGGRKVYVLHSDTDAYTLYVDPSGKIEAISGGTGQPPARPQRRP